MRENNEYNDIFVFVVVLSGFGLLFYYIVFLLDDDWDGFSISKNNRTTTSSLIPLFVLLHLIPNHFVPAQMIQEAFHDESYFIII
jgi:hypothetical protein